MSRSLSYLKSSAECLLRSTSQKRIKVLDGWKGDSTSGVNAVFLRQKRYASTTAASQPTGSQRVSERSEIDFDNVRDASSSNSLYPKKRRKADARPIVEHLKKLFPPLEFSDDAAMQMLTHKSAADLWSVHNGRLAFIGRRVLHSYTVLFLQSAALQLSRASPSTVDPTLPFDFDLLAYRATFTQILGEYVGNQWKLADVMQWRPPVSRNRMLGNIDSAKSPGLYKVQGTTVEGIMGGIYHQFGGTVAQRVFHTRLLPHILCPGTPLGLHDSFHHAAREMQAKMGGPYGLLITPSEAPRQQQKRDTHTSTPSQSKTSYEERENRSSAEFGQEKKRIAL